MWCVLVIERKIHNRRNHASRDGDVGNNVDVLNIWNCRLFEDSDWRWHTVYIELRFSFTAGLVFNMSIHWAHGLRFHTCIRSPWFNCAFDSVHPSRLSSSLPSLFDLRFGNVSYCAILCGRTERGAAAASKMALVHFSFCHRDLYFHLFLMALTLNALLAYLNQNHTGKARRSGHFVK